MTKTVKLVITVAFTLVGLALAVFVFGPNDLPYLAEISKFAPGVFVSILAMWLAHDSRDKAQQSRDEAKAAREGVTGRE